MEKLKKSHYLLQLFFILILFLFGLILRFYKLNLIPVSLYYDEMDYVLTGESINMWGSDFSGTWQPSKLRPLHTLNFTAELPAIFHSAILQIFGNDQVHLTSAIFGMLSILAVSFFIYTQTKRVDISLFVGATIIVNPWHIFISRMGYEAVISVFFQLIFIVCVWMIGKKEKQKDHWMWWILGLFISYFFAYFTYHGAKMTLQLLSLVGIIWIFYQPISRIRKIIITFLFFMLVGLSIFYTTQSIQLGWFGSRDSELLSLGYASQLVNAYRQASLNFPLDHFLINKFTVLIKETSQRYLSVFDIYRLVGSGYESGFQFSLIVHGFFYLSSLFFIIPGFAWWYEKFPRMAKYLSLMLFFSPAASVLTIGYQSIFRSALTYLLLLIFVGGGIVWCTEWLKRKKKSLIFPLFIWILLLTEVLFFGISYFTRYPIVSADNHLFTEKLLSSYVGRVAQPVRIVVDDYAYSKARSIIFYNDWLDNLSTNERMQFAQPQANTYIFSNVHISTDCPDLASMATDVQVVTPGKFQACHYFEFLSTQSAFLKNDQDQIVISAISSPIDSGAYFYLIYDDVCQGENLPHFIHNADLQKFDLQKLSNEQFCQSWVKVEEKM